MPRRARAGRGVKVDRAGVVHADWAIERAFAPFDAVFDLLEQSATALRRQAEALKESARALEHAAEMIEVQAETLERTVATLTRTGRDDQARRRRRASRLTPDRRKRRRPIDARQALQSRLAVAVPARLTEQLRGDADD
jgi:hypothetical protein